MNTAGGLKRAYLDDLNSAIQQNPLAAGLIGLGLLGMFVSRRGLGRMAAPIPDLAKSAATTVSSVAGSGMDQLRSGASAALTRKGSEADAASEADASSEAGASSSPHERLPFLSPDVDFGAMRQRIADACEQQPLLIGLAGVAVGAVVAAAFRPTALEQDMLGDAAASLREPAGAVVAEAKARAARAQDAMRDEAMARGLTPSDAQAQLRAAAQRIVEVAKSSVSDVSSSR